MPVVLVIPVMATFRYEPGHPWARPGKDAKMAPCRAIRPSPIRRRRWHRSADINGAENRLMDRATHTCAAAKKSLACDLLGLALRKSGKLKVSLLLICPNRGDGNIMRSMQFGAAGFAIGILALMTLVLPTSAAAHEGLPAAWGGHGNSLYPSENVEDHGDRAAR